MNTHMPKPRGKNHRAILTLANSPHPCRRCSVHTHRRTHAHTHTHIAVGWRHFACPCRLQTSSPDHHYCIRSLHQITAAAQKQEYILHYHSIRVYAHNKHLHSPCSIFAVLYAYQRLRIRYAIYIWDICK